MPVELFTDLLSRTTDLAELKAALAVVYLWWREEGSPVRFDALLAPGVLRSVVPVNSPEAAERRLRDALERATVNGSILRIRILRGLDTEIAFVPNSQEGRALIDELSSMQSAAGSRLEIGPADEVILDRPNVFSFYERHIGPLTPLVAEQLRGAERAYPRVWLERAILEAVHYNKRNWRYIEAILAQWEESGGPDGISGRHS